MQMLPVLPCFLSLREAEPAVQAAEIERQPCGQVSCNGAHICTSHFTTILHHHLLDIVLSIDYGRAYNMDIQLVGQCDRRVLYPSVHPYLLSSFLGRHIAHIDPVPRPRSVDSACSNILPLRHTSGYKTRRYSLETY